MNGARQWEPIPGETPIDPSGLKIDSVRTRRELNIVEAENVRKATIKYLGGRLNSRSAPFDHAWVLRLHAEMFGQVWEWAGRQRDRQLNLGCSPHEITEQLGHLLDDLKNWSSYNVPVLEQAAMLHHRAVVIHPFENGNGRWSRLLANIWLHRAEHPWIEWPYEGIGTASSIREEYLAALIDANNGQYSSLLLLQQKFLSQ
jgi:Fic-DOC domain mobile mystery protein B